MAVYLAHEANRSRRQRIEVDEIVRMGGRITYDWERVSATGKPLDRGATRRYLGSHLFSRVELVDLSRCHGITDDSLRNLGALDGLRRLWLADTPITGASFGHLANLTSLRELSLSGTRVTDASLRNLAALRGLEFLALDDTEITDEGLRNLRSLQTLRGLALPADGRFSAAAIAELEAALPNCDIEGL